MACTQVGAMIDRIDACAQEQFGHAGLAHEQMAAASRTRVQSAR